MTRAEKARLTEVGPSTCERGIYASSPRVSLSSFDGRRWEILGRKKNMARSPLKRKRPAQKVDIDYPLKKVFQKEAFRPLQREIITAALEGEDIFVQAATSFGKSLCFQLPAWCSKGVTIVVSPLLALVQNQVTAANNLGVPAHSITSDTPFTLRKEIEADLQCGHPYTRLLYVTPELCSTENFRKILRRLHQQGQLIRVAIDEAHCISEWGMDFRPAYKELRWLKANLQCPAVPIMALTATATPKVRKDIFKYLNLKEDRTLFFSTSTARPNIHYEVQYFSEANAENEDEGDLFPYLLAWLTAIHNRRLMMLEYYKSRVRQDGTKAEAVPAISGIVYANTRNMTESIASKLQAAGVYANAYHGGMEPHQRMKVQNQFIRQSTEAAAAVNAEQAEGDDHNEEDIAKSFNIITATAAFGMGIDIPTIRFVVHYGIPRNLESFIQESGRAGRDSKAAQSLVLYTREERDRTIFRVKADIQRDAARAQHQTTSSRGITPAANAHLNSQFDPSQTATQVNAQAEQKMKSLQKVIEYCENVSVCRHKLITEYFGRTEEMVSMGAASSRSIVQTEVQCDYACDVCKEGAASLRARRDKGLATNEQASQYTQSQRWEYE